eukprot:scaffold21332_cov197-Skeletonema_menzelii.AAC.8
MTPMMQNESTYNTFDLFSLASLGACLALCKFRFIGGRQQKDQRAKDIANATVFSDKEVFYVSLLPSLDSPDSLDSFKVRILDRNLSGFSLLSGHNLHTCRCLCPVSLIVESVNVNSPPSPPSIMNQASFVEIHENFPGGLAAYRRQTIHRINSNDPRVIQVHIDNILSQDEGDVESFASALRGNTHLKYVCFGNDEYDMDHLDTVLSALAETK